MSLAEKASLQTGSLSAAIELARLGRKSEARRMLRDSCAENPANAKAWLWSASLSETVVEAVNCLKRVLALEPENSTAREWYAKLRPTLVQVRVYYCFLCRYETEEEFSRCPHCGSLLSLDLEETLAGGQVNEQKVRTAIERLKAAEGADEDFDTQYFIGVGYLNLCDTHSALGRFRRAERLDPRGRDLGGIIETLSQRPLIMAVDDCLTIRAMVSRTRERNGYRCLLASGGIDALSYLEEDVPQFVLLDVAMPYMDGYMLCKEIKSRPKTKNAAVVMLSASDGFFDKVKGRMAGAADYLTKPFEPALLLRVIRKYVQ